MKRKIFPILVSIIFLSSCSQEPVIQLSQERQAAIEALKNKENEAEKSNQQDEAVTFNVDTFEVDESDITYDNITDFIPLQPNQRMTMSNNEGVSLAKYMDFVDGSLRAMQVREVQADTTKQLVYAWNDEQLLQMQDLEASIVPNNELALATSQESDATVLLQAPLTKGTQWQASENATASITQIYQKAHFAAGEFSDVIEVTYELPEHQVKYYFAKSIGLVATMQNEKADQSKSQQWQASEVVSDTQFSQAIMIYQPQKAEGTQLVEAAETMSWQTNDTPAAMYTRLFQSLGWISSDITINSITVSDQMVTVDFTPGVVAAMNQHTTTETGVIPAIVATVAKHFNRSQVALTVNGLGLLPDTLPYPDGGIWQVNNEWFQVAQQ